ncbi:MAG: cytidylate kinase-like family protein [Verrucomicrobia bacterium]|nr:cytidylate kinase-like family protein [Verrucomicrobiota bacterium]
MKTGINTDKCLSFVSCELNPQPKQWLPHTQLRPAVTISRQTGSGAMAIAGELAAFLQAWDPAQCHWMVIDKNLVEIVLEEHKLPKEIAKFMPEDRVSAIQDAVEELLGLHPSSRTLLHQTSETIRHLAQLGNVILVGRASHIITRQMQNVFHVRLIAPLEKRVERVMAHRQLDRKTVQEFIRKEDLGRKRYLKDHFQADIDDNLQYDLVVNTARLPHQEVAHLIGAAVLHWAETL